MYQPMRRSNGAGCVRPQRLAQILTALYDQAYPELHAQQANAGEWRGWLTTGQLAKACGLSPSPHFRQMLYELYQEGSILAKAGEWRPNINAHYWAIGVNTRWSERWVGVFDAYLGENFAQSFSSIKHTEE